MKKFLFSVALAMLSLAAFATGQSADVVYIDGEAWMLLARPITVDRVLAHSVKQALPDNCIWSTANWDGVTGIWSIRDSKLCLDSVVYETRDESTNKVVRHCLSAEVMKSIFDGYFEGNDIVAGWCSDTLRAAQGRTVYYEHMGFMRYHETEQVLVVDQGKVTHRKTYHNSVAKGLSGVDLANKQKVKSLFPLRVADNLELAGVKQVGFWVSHIRLDSSGRLVDCVVEAEVRKQGERIKLPSLAAEMKAAMQSHHPWEVYFVDGEYRALPSSFRFYYPLED